MTRRRTAHTPRGMTLVELMIGLAIGLLATLVITQITTIWEAKKRTTSSGADAQVNGALALQQLQRDIQMAGYGSAMNGAAGCWVRGKLLTTALSNYRLAPVVITDGGTGNPDQIRVLVSNGESLSIAMTTSEDVNKGTTSFVLQDDSNIGNHQGDLMMAIPEAGTCEAGTLGTNSAYASLFNISAAPSGNNIPLATGTDGPWNHNATDTIFPDLDTTTTNLSYRSGSTLVNLGSLTSTRGVPLYRDYRVNSQVLQSLTLTASGRTSTTATATTSTEDLATQIVDLQAVYGHDTTATRDNVVDSWNTTSPTTLDGWTRVIAVRVAVVARSTQYEQTDVTDAAPSDCTSTSITTNYPRWKPDGSTWACLNISGLDSYRRYRYRVFEIVVPLRNMLWQS